MRAKLLLLLLALASIVHTSPAAAQRGGRGGGRHGGGNSSDNTPVAIPNPVNAVNLVLAHLTDLALTDSQVRRVVVIKRALDSTNVPLMRDLDSLRRVIAQSGTRPLPQLDSVAVKDPHTMLLETIANIRANIYPARDSAYAILSAAQLDKIKVFEGEAEQQYEDQMSAVNNQKSKRGG